MRRGTGAEFKTEYQPTKRLEIFSKLCKYIASRYEQKAASSLETREQKRWWVWWCCWYWPTGKSLSTAPAL